jgi:hypothetical protein
LEKGPQTSQLKAKKMMRAVALELVLARRLWGVNILSRRRRRKGDKSGENKSVVHPCRGYEYQEI